MFNSGPLSTESVVCQECEPKVLFRRHQPCTCQMIIVNGTDRPIIYKLKTARNHKFKVTPKAQSHIGPHLTHSLIVTWLSASENLSESPKLLIQSRFAEVKDTRLSRTRLDVVVQPIEEGETDGAMPKIKVILQERQLDQVCVAQKKIPATLKSERNDRMKPKTDNSLIFHICLGLVLLMVILFYFTVNLWVTCSFEW